MLNQYFELAIYNNIELQKINISLTQPKELINNKI